METEDKSNNGHSVEDLADHGLTAAVNKKDRRR